MKSLKLTFYKNLPIEFYQQEEHGDSTKFSRKSIYSNVLKAD